MSNVGLRASKRSRARNFIITLNNPRQRLCDYEQIWKEASVEYTGQIEKGESGTTHLQAFLRFAVAVDFSRAKRLFGSEQPHIERCRNVKQSEEYCRKAETRVEGPVVSIDPAAFQGQTSRRLQRRRRRERRWPASRRNTRLPTSDFSRLVLWGEGMAVGLSFFI